MPIKNVNIYLILPSSSLISYNKDIHRLNMNMCVLSGILYIATRSLIDISAAMITHIH